MPKPPARPVPTATVLDRPAEIVNRCRVSGIAASSMRARSHLVSSSASRICTWSSMHCVTAARISAACILSMASDAFLIPSSRSANRRLVISRSSRPAAASPNSKSCIARPPNSASPGTRGCVWRRSGRTLPRCHRAGFGRTLRGWTVRHRKDTARTPVPRTPVPRTPVPHRRRQVRRWARCRPGVESPGASARSGRRFVGVQELLARDQQHQRDAGQHDDGAPGPCGHPGRVAGPEATGRVGHALAADPFRPLGTVLRRRSGTARVLVLRLVA